MEQINYDDTRIQGGVNAFADVIGEDRTESEEGSLRTPSIEAARTYAKFMESVIRSQQSLAEDEILDKLAA